MLKILVILNLLYYLYRIIFPFDLIFYKHILKLNHKLTISKIKSIFNDIDVFYKKKLKKTLYELLFMQIQQLIDYVLLFYLYSYIPELRLFTIVRLIIAVYILFRKNIDYVNLDVKDSMYVQAVYRTKNIIDYIYYMIAAIIIFKR